jgi:hypothetical protein
MFFNNDIDEFYELLPIDDIWRCDGIYYIKIYLLFYLTYLLFIYSPSDIDN